MAMQTNGRRLLRDHRRVVVVGPCASGKTTLAQALMHAGYDAKVCGQEHSGIPDLWRRMGGDVLIALDLDIATLRARRGDSWPADLLERQHQRLSSAYAAADLVIDSGRVDQRGIVEAVARLLNDPVAVRRD